MQTLEPSTSSIVQVKLSIVVVFLSLGAVWHWLKDIPVHSSELEECFYFLLKGRVVCGIRATSYVALFSWNTEKPHDSLVIFHLPEKASGNHILEFFCAVCCKHAHSDRPSLCRPLEKHRRSSIYCVSEWPWRIHCVNSKGVLYLSVYCTERGLNQTPAVWITLWIFVLSAT